MEPCTLGRRFRQRNGVRDRAYPERRMVECVDPVLKSVQQDVDELRMFLPELSERAGGFAEGPVDQHQGWRFARSDGGLRLSFERPGQNAIELVHTGIDLGVERRTTFDATKSAALSSAKPVRT